jgi:hypothetical protein
MAICCGVLLPAVKAVRTIVMLVSIEVQSLELIDPWVEDWLVCFAAGVTDPVLRLVPASWLPIPEVLSAIRITKGIAINTRTPTHGGPAFISPGSRELTFADS